MTLTLTAHQRLAFAQFLGAQPGLKNPWGSKDVVRTAMLLAKIRLPDTEVEKYVKPIGDGRAIIDNAGLRNIADLSIEVGAATVELLKVLFRAWEPKTVDEVSWAMPIKAQISPEDKDDEI